MNNWTKVKSEPGVQTWEMPLHPDSVEQIRSDDVEQMLVHTYAELANASAYPDRPRMRTRGGSPAAP
jgi:hypothetical protein